MLRTLLLLLSICSIPVAAKVQLLASLPGAATSRAMQLDSAGNLYLTGTAAIPNPQPSQNVTDVFVAKVSADGSKVLYYTTFGGSFAESPAGIVLGSDGSAYVAGSTESSDFPVTPGAYQPTMNPRGASQGFLVKVNPAGAVVYSSYINGTAFTTISGIAIDKSGQIYLTGSGGPAYPLDSNLPQQGFVLKLNATLTAQQLSVYGYGAGLIQVDGQGNIYLAGSAVPASAPNGSLPPFPAGAFQTTLNGRFCSVSTGPDGGLSRFCQYQYVAKLDPTGKLLWGTYVTGTYGATTAGMAVDSAGNVVVAGTTNSDDYPVTAGAFQTAYTPAAPPPPNSNSPFTSFTGPPNATAYVTKVNATGTALLWSTYFGGSFQDQITGMAVAPSGDIVLSGRAGSNDLGFADIPPGCRPSANQVLGFVATLAPDGATAGATQPIAGAPDCLYINCNLNDNLTFYQTGWPLGLRADGTAVVAGSNGTVAAVDSTAGSRVACVIDPADNAQLNSVAPGQLVTLFGAELGPVAPNVPAGGAGPSSADSLGVFFNSVPAPILYASQQQINVQVPFEIAGSGSVQMQVVSRNIPNPVSETHTLAVVERQPSIFLSPAALLSQQPGYSTCGSQILFGQTAVAINADGTLNDCSNPAVVGSVVTVLVNGFGPSTPALATGILPPGPPVALTPAFTPGPFTGTTTLATQSLPGGISGVVQVQLRDGSEGATLLNGASLGDVLLRDRVIEIWVK